MSAEPKLHSLQVPRTARYATLGDPTTAESWWVVLHGYGQLAADFVQNFESVASPNRCIIAPEGLSRFYVDGMSEHERVGASWMTREARDDEIRDYVAALDAVVTDLGADEPPPVCALGYSQGAATASRWAVLGKTEIRRLVLWGGPPAHDIDLDVHRDAFARMDLALVLGTNDPHIPPKRRQATLRTLREHDLPVSVHEYEGGHELVDEPLREIITAPSDQTSSS